MFPYKALQAGDESIGLEIVKRCKLACGNQAQLKVIIESGELADTALIKRAAEICIEGGADFVKTSTGKVPVNATIEATRVMLETVKASGKPVGFKAAGGIRTTAQAQEYIQLAQAIMGEGWVTPDHFRFGASGLVNDLKNTMGLAPTEQQKSNY